MSIATLAFFKPSFQGGHYFLSTYYLFTVTVYYTSLICYPGYTSSYTVTWYIYNKYNVPDVFLEESLTIH